MLKLHIEANVHNRIDVILELEHIASLVRGGHTSGAYWKISGTEEKYDEDKNALSICCNADLIDKNTLLGEKDTNFYICTQCHSPCNFIIEKDYEIPEDTRELR